MGTTWRQCGDNMGTMEMWRHVGQHGWGQHEDNVKTTWGQHGDHGDVETTWEQCGDNTGQHEDNVEITWGQHGDNMGTT